MLNFGLAITAAIVTLVAVLWMRKKMNLRHARTWPKVAGSVDSTSLNMESTGTNQQAWAAVVKYSYIIQGGKYIGTLRHQFVQKGAADKWIGKYTEGLPLTVRYDPTDPMDSVLFDDEQSWGGAA